MGAEDFRVKVVCRKALDVVVTQLLSLKGTHVDTERRPLPTETLLVHEDGAHLFELELATLKGLTHLSIRFAVCQPRTVDQAFALFVLRLLPGLDVVSVRIMEDLQPGTPGEFPPAPLVELPQAIVIAVEEKRRAWEADFGAAVATVRCDEALRRFVMREADR